MHQPTLQPRKMTAQDYQVTYYQVQPARLQHPAEIENLWASEPPDAWERPDYGVG